MSGDLAYYDRRREAVGKYRRQTEATWCVDGVWPCEVERRLWHCRDVKPWGKTEVLRRWRWAVGAYSDLFIDKDEVREERARFLKEGLALIAMQDLIDGHRRAAEIAVRPLSEQEQLRRNEWLRSEAQRTERAEQRRQRALLREGHTTLKAIRRVLRGADRLPLPASEPARTSPTS